MTTPRKRRCMAKGCSEQISPELLMCRRHWDMVPASLQQKICLLNNSPAGAVAGDYWKCCSRAIAEVAKRETAQLALPF